VLWCALTGCASGGGYGPGTNWENPSFNSGYDFETPPPEIEGPVEDGVRTPDGVKTFPPTGYRDLDARTWFYYGIYGISPVAANRLSGIGSKYLMANVDANRAGYGCPGHRSAPSRPGSSRPHAR
jgi:hypothetical protein